MSRKKHRAGSNILQSGKREQKKYEIGNRSLTKFGARMLNKNKILKIDKYRTSIE